MELDDPKIVMAVVISVFLKIKSVFEYDNDDGVVWKMVKMTVLVTVVCFISSF